jgi:hypothetical protein
MAQSDSEAQTTPPSTDSTYFNGSASAWHNDYRALKGRRKAAKQHWWKTRTDPFAQTWPLVESWIAAEPNITAKALVVRLRKELPDLYPTGAQLRTLQRRVKAWRGEWARRPVFASAAIQSIDKDSIH